MRQPGGPSSPALCRALLYVRWSAKPTILSLFSLPTAFFFLLLNWCFLTLIHNLTKILLCILVGIQRWAFQHRLRVDLSLSCPIHVLNNVIISQTAGDVPFRAYFLLTRLMHLTLATLLCTRILPCPVSMKPRRRIVGAFLCHISVLCL